MHYGLHSHRAAIKSCQRFILLALSLLLAIIPSPFASASGVTVITHGRASNADGWVRGMAAAIPAYPSFPGTKHTIYKVALSYSKGYSLTWSRIAGVLPMAADSGEIIVTFDWGPLSDGNSYNTYQIAPLLAQALTSTDFISELNGHALCEQPIHLIGHSRGASLICETTRILGANGIWVDHLTTLDPYPLNNDGNRDPAYSAVDAPCITYENVLFHDDYWQALGSSVEGEAVPGAYNRILDDMSGGYVQTGSYIFQHSNVHLWYHGTINVKTPISDNIASISAAERKKWWTDCEAQGAVAGFYYSRVGRGDRTSTNTIFGAAVRDGYNHKWDLGDGIAPNRTALDANNGTWPNIIEFKLTGTNLVSQSDPLHATLYYQYGGASNLTADIFLDRDFNPYNENSTSVASLQPQATGTGSVSSYRDLGLATTNITPGVYAVYARISDGQRARFLYAAEKIEITATLQPPALDITLLENHQTVIRVNGSSGQIAVLEISQNLKNWLPAATNTLANSPWIITNSLPVDQQFYRTVLSR